MKDEIHPTPAELQEARRHTKKALRRSRARLQKDEPVKLCIVWTEEEFVLESMDGVAGRAFGPNTIRIRFNTQPADWVPCLKSTAVHEFAHAWNYEKSNQTPNLVWQHALDEAISQNIAERLYPHHETPWRRKHSADKIAEFWSDIKNEEFGTSIQEVGRPIPLYINQSDQVQYPNWLGYSMSYLLGKELLNDRKLEEMPDVSRQELVDAGDRLFAKP